MQARVSFALLLAVAVSNACVDTNDDDFRLPTDETPAPVSETPLDGGVLLDATLQQPTEYADAGARAQDSRRFTFDAAALPALDPLPSVETDRWSGELDGAGYRIEVPKTNWNGVLVMYAHGYSGTGESLRLSTPSIRRHLIEKGYAWAASSYTTNYYDVRAGVEDTNRLALAFTDIATANGRPLTPSKRYIIGHSMGGHIAGAAVERETYATAKNKVQYQAALPMCGVMGDVELFNYFAAYQIAAHQLAGIPVTATPFADYAATRAQVQSALFTTFSTATTPAGDKLRNIVKNLTGGARPVFEQGFANTSLQTTVWGTFGGDGTIAGILNLPVTDTRAITYELDDDPQLSAEERAFNEQAFRSEPAGGANGLRTDGLRWVPVVNGEFDVPVLTLHTLGDMYVPFSMQQVYRQRAQRKGNGERLVQRAIRGIGHCEFTYREQTDAFDALVAWEQTNVRPEGDDVLTPTTLADPRYGCKFTTTPGADDVSTLAPLRATVACPPAP